MEDNEVVNVVLVTEVEDVLNSHAIVTIGNSITRNRLDNYDENIFICLHRTLANPSPEWVGPTPDKIICLVSRHQ